MVLLIFVKYKIGSSTNNRATCHVFIGINVHHKKGKKKEIEQDPKFLNRQQEANKSEPRTPSPWPALKSEPEVARVQHPC